VIGSSIATFAVLKALDDIPPWGVKLIETQAVGMLGFLVTLGCVVYFAPRLIAALQHQALAMTAVAEQMRVMSGQSGKLDDIKSSLDDMNLNIAVFAERLKNIEEKVSDVSRGDT